MAEPVDILLEDDDVQLIARPPRQTPNVLQNSHLSHARFTLPAEGRCWREPSPLISEKHYYS